MSEMSGTMTARGVVAGCLTGVMLLALAGCGGGGEAPSADVASELVEILPIPDTGDWCPRWAPVAGPVELLPRPSVVFDLGGPMSLAGLEIAWQGATAAEAEELTALAGECGFVPGIPEAASAVVVTFHDSGEWQGTVADCGFEPEEIPGAYLLRAAVSEGLATRGKVEILAADELGRFYALKTLRQLLGNRALRPAHIFDRPAIAMRGLIEGFYGQPWLPAQRLAMVAQAAGLKLNHFVFAPKGEALINTAWMLPFPAEFLLHIEELAETGRRNHVRICFELHPSWAFHYSSQEDFDLVVGKFEAVIARGIDCAAIAFDDVSPLLVPPDDEVYASYTQAQVDFVTRLGEALKAAHPDLLLAYVPVEYFTNHPGAAEALPLFGEALPPHWQIAWTGTEVGSPTVSLADAQAVAGLLKRPPLLGDNYPVSDDANKTGVVNLGPLAGRAPDLPAALSGLAFNAMPLPYASLPALATAADYAWNPLAYEPVASAQAAAALLTDSAAQSQALLTLCLANRSVMLEGSEAPELEQALALFWQEWEAGMSRTSAADSLSTSFFQPYAKVAAGLAGAGIHAGLQQELKPWAEKLTAYGKAGEQALTLLLQAAGGRAPTADEAAALAAEIEQLKSQLPKPTGSLMTNFLDRALVELEAY